MSQLCYTGRFQQSNLPKKTWRAIKLQNIDKVVDSSVNMQRSARTVQKTVEGAQVHQNDEFVAVPVAVHVETARVLPPIFVPQKCQRHKRHRKLRKLTERIVEVPVVQKEQIQ